MTPAKLLAWAGVLQLCRACPAPCSCRWRQGKQAAACAGAGLGAVPTGLDNGTQVLDLSGNDFREIASQIFRRHGLVNLQKIFLSDCAIASIAADAFFQLSNLVELDLSHNQLPAVPTKSLQSCPNLRRLQLSHNPITLVERGAFSNLFHLSYLSLGNCQIQHVVNGAFDGLNKLEVIELDGNQLTTLSSGIFKSMTDLFGLHLYNNPWNCDCKIRDLRTWMIENNIPLSVSPYCISPPLLRKNSWNNLTIEDFACAPQIIQGQKEYTVISGHNVSIYCSVHAVPKAFIHWEIDGQLLTDLRPKYQLINEEVSSRQASILTIYNVTKAHSLFCVAENKAGSSAMNFSLTVLHPSSPWSVTQIALLIFCSLFGLLLLSGLAICLFLSHPTSWSKLNKKPSPAHIKAGSVDRKGTDHPESGSDQLTPDVVSNFADGPALTCAPNFDRGKLQMERNDCSEAYQRYALEPAGLHSLDSSYASPHFRRYSMLVVDASSNYPPPSKSSFSPDEGYDEEGLEITQV